MTLRSDTRPTRAELRPVGNRQRLGTPQSRWIHRIGDATTHSTASIVVLVAVAGWCALGAVYDFPEWWSTTLFAVSGAVTLVMVFIIQHTQARLEIATQRKLDELLRSHPEADNRLIAAEVASDAELTELAERHLDAHERAVSDDAD